MRFLERHRHRAPLHILSVGELLQIADQPSGTLVANDWKIWLETQLLPADQAPDPNVPVLALKLGDNSLGEPAEVLLSPPPRIDSKGRLHLKLFSSTLAEGWWLRLTMEDDERRLVFGLPELRAGEVTLVADLSPLGIRPGFINPASFYLEFLESVAIENWDAPRVLGHIQRLQHLFLDPLAFFDAVSLMVLAAGPNWKQVAQEEADSMAHAEVRRIIKGACEQLLEFERTWNRCNRREEPLVSVIQEGLNGLLAGGTIPPKRVKHMDETSRPKAPRSPSDVKRPDPKPEN